MKKINLIFALLLSTFLMISCDDSGEITDVDSGLASGSGAITTLSGTIGKLLGNVANPADLENSEVALTDANAELTLKLSMEPGHIPANVSKYEIVKFYKGNEVSVAETSELPFTAEYSTVADYFDGFGTDMTSVRIGDQIVFRIKVHTNDGNSYFVSSSKSIYTVTVNCASDLAGAYSLRFTSNFGHDITFPNEIISEVNPGEYKTTTTYRWAAGSIAPDQGFNFTDVCGTVSVPQQGLAQGYYSNQVYGFEDGLVEADGTIKIYYIIEFSGGATKIECTGVYTKL